MNKDGVIKWETIATYVSVFSNGDDDGACDVDVAVGEHEGLWYVRTRDDSGGSDDADDTAYSCYDDACNAAEALAAGSDDGDGRENASEYLERRLREAAAIPTNNGEWCVYWETALDDSEPLERYDSYESALAAAELSNNELSKAHPGGNLLCRFSVRKMNNGKWVDADDPL